MISNYAKCIIRHYETGWNSTGRTRHWSRGPTHQLSPGFCVLEFAPTSSRDMWTYATCCMSQIEDEQPVELHLFAPNASDRLVELLTIVAHYHRTGSRLDVGHSVDFGRPWLPESACTFGLVSLPYLDGPKIENLTVPELHVKVQCCWLIPITEKEVEYKKLAGVDALEHRFEEASFNYLDPQRASVV